MVRLVAALEPAQDRDGVLDARLADEHLLEPALERRVLLDVLAELVERGRADHPQLAAGEHRLEHVAGVHRALGLAGADDRVQLVDERDDLAVGGLDLLEDGLEPLLELAAVLRARRPSTPRSSATIRLPRRDSGTSPATMRWASPSTTAVLPTPGSPMSTGLFFVRRRQHLDDAADLGVAADDRVELAVAGPLGEVDAVLLQRLVGALRVLVGHPAHAAADLVERVDERLGERLLPAQQRRRPRRRTSARPTSRCSVET